MVRKQPGQGFIPFGCDAVASSQSRSSKYSEKQDPHVISYAVDIRNILPVKMPLSATKAHPFVAVSLMVPSCSCLGLVRQTVGSKQRNTGAGELFHTLEHHMKLHRSSLVSNLLILHNGRLGSFD